MSQSYLIVSASAASYLKMRRQRVSTRASAVNLHCTDIDAQFPSISMSSFNQISPKRKSSPLRVAGFTSVVRQRSSSIKLPKLLISIPEHSLLSMPRLKRGPFILNEVTRAEGLARVAKLYEASSRLILKCSGR
mmetsp:Transcript_21695/g.39606  ORF Transcript_21695/g.39606 Transcript_21695/m.39606 type:complete len:134 (-) Transcript_21695:376-777(-)